MLETILIIVLVGVVLNTLTLSVTMEDVINDRVFRVTTTLLPFLAVVLAVVGYIASRLKRRRKRNGD